MKNSIKCNCCGRPLMSVDERDKPGTIASKVVIAGYVAANPVLYTGISEWLYYCSDDCKILDYKTVLHPVNKKHIRAVTNTIEELRAEVPNMAKATVKFILQFAHKSKIE